MCRNYPSFAILFSFCYYFFAVLVPERVNKMNQKERNKRVYDYSKLTFIRCMHVSDMICSGSFEIRNLLSLLGRW